VASCVASLLRTFHFFRAGFFVRSQSNFIANSDIYSNVMASWKYTLTLCIIAAISVSANGRVKDKRLRGNRNDRDKVARGALGIL